MRSSGSLGSRIRGLLESAGWEELVRSQPRAHQGLTSGRCGHRRGGRSFVVPSVRLPLPSEETNQPWRHLVETEVKEVPENVCYTWRKQSPPLTGTRPVSALIGSSVSGENNGLGKTVTSSLMPHNALMQLKPGETAKLAVGADVSNNENPAQCPSGPEESQHITVILDYA